MKKSISGIRGIFGDDDMTLKDVIHLCNNFTTLLTQEGDKEPKCVVARDTRPSSNMVYETSLAALMQNGIDVYELGMAPTPVVFRESRKYGAGLNVTSSHNPIQWNGLKFILEGRGINQKELDVITSNTLHNDNKYPDAKRIGLQKNNINSDYIDDAMKLVGDIDGSSLNVVIDIGGGAAVDVAPNFLKRLGCTVTTINDSIATSTRGPDPTSDDLVDLVLKSKSADVGFAFDLDGDRLVVVKDGKKQIPDITLGLGVAKALDFGYKNYVLSIDTSVAVEKFILQNGGKVTRSKVGEANVIDEMLKTGAHAGGEGSSAGFILPEFNYCRDGILTSGLIASMINESSFNQVLSFMESYHQIRDKVAVNLNLQSKVLDNVHEEMSTMYSQLITIDGIKGIIDEDSWVLVRKSNTEDIIRISVESNKVEKTKTILKDIRTLVEQSYEKIR